MSEVEGQAITPRGVELGGTAPDSFDAVAMARELLRIARTAPLATLDPASGFPLSTLVNVATDVDGTPLLLLSKLALHTRNLDADPRCSILCFALGKGDPMANSKRVSVAGRALRTDDSRARRRFLARHPKSKLYIDFPDFSLFRLEVSGLHPNGGFARAAEIATGDVLLDLTGCDALIEAEEGAVAHMNEDHAEALALYATRLLGEPEGRWRATGLDPEGLDLVCGDAAARLVFPERVTSPGALRAALVALAQKARAAA
ncbi:HugZ family protein [Bosea sp. 2KB_26]|uniref:HugZ family pyridoxamine 5'-phosphate oxidase n=1 Tax=Bosea sp. 2KB_26 TaxID=3237475 RepID=UPI000DE267F1